MAVLDTDEPVVPEAPHDEALASLRATEAAPEEFRPVEYFLLRAAAVDARDVVTAGDRVLYCTIGFFVCFFGVYGLVGFGTFFARAGSVDVGPKAVGILVTVIGALLISAAIAVFDRSVVAQINSGLDDLRALPNQDHDTARLARIDSLLQPVGKLSKRPLRVRVLIALVIGFFATQGVEMQLFAGDIRSKRVEKLEQEIEQTKAVREGELEKAQGRFVDRVNALEGEARRLHADAISARHRQHGGLCLRGSCATLMAQLAGVNDELQHLQTPTAEDRKKGAVPPSDHGSRESQAVAEQQQRLKQLHEHSDQVPEFKQASPLQDVNALYDFVASSRGALLFYTAFMVIMLAVDTAAIGLKYYISPGTNYERRQALRQQSLWYVCAHAAERDERLAMQAVDDQAVQRREHLRLRALRADAAMEARTAQVQALRTASNAFADSSEFRTAAEQHARQYMLDGLRSASVSAAAAADTDTADPGPATYPSAEEPAAEDRAMDAEVIDATYVDATRSWPSSSTVTAPSPGVPPSGDVAGAREDAVTRKENDKALLLEVLGVGAGLALVVSTLGVIYLAGQLADAHIAQEALASMPPQQILLAGGKVAFVVIPITWALAEISEPLLVRLHDSVPAEVRAARKETFFRLVAASAAMVARLLRRVAAPRTWWRPRRFSPRAVPSDVLEYAPAGAAVVSAGVVSDNGWLALLAGGTSGLTVSIMIVGALLLCGWVNPRSRRFRAALLLCATVGVALAVYVAGHFIPLRLHSATVRLAGRSQCLEGRFLGQDSIGVHLVDGDAGAVRVVPARDVAALSIDHAAAKVRDEPIHDIPCPAVVSVTSR